MPRSVTRSSRIASTCICTVTSSAEVGSSAISRSGLGDQHHRDHDALAHAARDLVRIERGRRAPGRGSARPPASRAPAGAPRRQDAPECTRQRLGDLVADGHHRVQRELRVLQDHRDPLRRGCRRIAGSLAVRRSIPSKASRRAVTRPGRRHQAAGWRGRSSTCPSPTRRRCRAARGRASKHTPRTASTVADARPGSGRAGPRPSRSGVIAALIRPSGRATSRRPSPSRLKPRLTTKMAMPGHRGDPPLVEQVTAGPMAIIAPHSGAGGCAPRPRKPRPAAVRMMPAMSSVDADDQRRDAQRHDVAAARCASGDGALQPHGRDEVASAGSSASRPARRARTAART